MPDGRGRSLGMLLFAKPETQLPLFLDAMREAGFAEYDFEKAGHCPRQEDFWRAVPNRKWYTWLRTDMKQSKEILIVHRAC